MVFDWVEKLSDPERREYYNKTIVFDCPLTKKRHRIRDCIDRCEFSATKYRSTRKGGVASFVYCPMDCLGERDVETGKITRDN